jgi:hypothetical protein
MTVSEYERVGRFIYGAHRLDGVLASMHVWMAEQLPGSWPRSDESPPEQRCLERTAVANAYYTAHLPGQTASSLVHLIESVRDLETASGAVRADAGAQLDGALGRLHAAHLGLAATIDQLGYHARTAASLRECAAELPVSAA